MWKGLILACLIGTPAPECQPKVAVDVFRPPTKLYNSLYACQFESPRLRRHCHTERNVSLRSSVGSKGIPLGGAAG
jgi:hypothetical protein